MDQNSKTHKELTQSDFESQRRAISLDILRQTHQFIQWDLEFNKHISNLAEELVKQIKNNPRILESDSEVGKILKEMQNEKDGGISGADIFGGNAWQDIWGTIKEVLLGEKEFIQKIISKILDL